IPGIPRDSKVFQRIPRDSLGFHGIFLGFQVVLTFFLLPGLEASKETVAHPPNTSAATPYQRRQHLPVPKWQGKTLWKVSRNRLKWRNKASKGRVAEGGKRAIELKQSRRLNSTGSEGRRVRGVME